MQELTVEMGARVERRHELSRLQREVWASQRRHPDAPVANMGTLHRIDGVVDPERFTAAFERVVGECDALRMVVDDGTRPGVRVLAHPPGRTEVIDLDAAELDLWVGDRVARPVDVTTCGYDSVLLRHDHDDWSWWLDLHHVITDATSQAIVFEEVARLYEDPSAEVEIASFVAHRVDVDSAEPADPDPNEAARPTPLRPFGTRGSTTTASPAMRIDLAGDPATLADRTQASFPSVSADLSVLALLASGLAIAVHRTDGHRSVVVGVPVHRRTDRVSRRVVGPLMELYPVEVTILPDDTASSLVTRTSKSVVRMLRTSRTAPPTRQDFEVVVNVVRVPVAQLGAMGVDIRWIRAPHVDPAHSLRLHASDHGRGLELELDVNEALAAGVAAQRLSTYVGTAIDSLLADPGGPVSAIDLITSADLADLAALTPRSPAPPDLRPVHVAVRDGLHSDPDRIVAEHGDRRVDAAGFDRLVGRSRAWLQSCGVRQGDRVGLRMERGIDVLIAVQAVLRCGAAFVMLDPGDPSSRHDAIADDADLRMIVDDLTAIERFEPVDVGTDPEPDAEPDVDLDAIAYVLYTSGSTGRPKGVPISHRGLADYLAFARSAYCGEGDDGPIVALHSKLIFDLTITSIFLPFVTGGTVVVFDGDPVVALGRVATDDRITFLKATPSQLEILARMTESPRNISTVVVGGEAFRRPVAVATAAMCAPGARIFNEYGPTEAVVGCMIHEWSPTRDVGTEVPIGAAAPGCELTVAGPDGHPTPSGAWGELYVRRHGMATGYLNRADLTAERFVDLHDVPGALGGTERGPWYRTGDRVRLERPGVLVYGGRLDDQLKVNGVRLEPAEVEAALVRHPRIESALVRVWTPGDRTATRRCERCGLGDDVPEVTVDDAGLCSTCRSFDAIAPQTEAWFRDERDLDAELDRARARSTGDYDCLHLLSGGKDSSYALYQLVERGWRVHALTLDNGFISDGAKENIRASVEALGITHEFAAPSDPAVMNEILRDSLDRYSNVCQGCYKTIYTMAVARADELGIPVVVTGLSRGQFFETRLIPSQFEPGRFDPDAIDATVLAARKVYHQVPDAVTELLPEQAVFDDVSVFERVEFLDFYRYVDVDLSELYRFLEERAPWVRPADTGRSTNCLINVAGIQVHQAERGYHSYAEPYAWDVRLGHKTRREALDELDDRLVDGVDDAAVAPMLHEVGYRSKQVEVLTAWYTTVDGEPLDPERLRRHVRDLVAESAVPAAFVHLDEMPLAASAKADASALPAPTRFHRRADEIVLASTAVERSLAEVWAEVLHLEQVGVTDDFFDLGGDSLAALEVVATMADSVGLAVDDAAVFEARTIRELASLVEADPTGATAVSFAPIPRLAPDAPPPLSPGEEAMLFEYRRDPTDTRYNVTRWYRLPADVDLPRLETAVREVAATHGPTSRSFDATRRRLPPELAVEFRHGPQMTHDEFAGFASHQRAVPFDLDRGPLVRVDAATTTRTIDRPDGERVEAVATSVLIGMHHISIDAGTFDVFWHQVTERYDDPTGGSRTVPATSDLAFAAHGEWQRNEIHQRHRGFWRDERRRAHEAGPATTLGFAAPDEPRPDGYLNRPLDLSTVELRRGPARTPFVAALAAASLAVARYSRAGARGSVEMGITASVKDHPATTPLVGYFLNTLPVRVDVGAASTAGALVEQVGETVADAVEHRSYPFASIVRDARADGVAAPDVSVMLAYERLAPASLGGEVVEHEILASGTAVSDVTLFVQERGDDLSIGIEYSGRVLSESDAQRLLDGFAAMLDDVTHRPDASTTSLVACPPGETVSELVGDRVGDTAPTVLHEILRRCETAPDAVAVSNPDGRSWTSMQVLAAAVETADAIDAAVDGGAAGRLVGVCVGRSVDMVAAILGVQLAGAGYVPLDPAAPDERLATIMESVEVAAVVADLAGERRLAVGSTGVVATTPTDDDRIADPDRAAIVDRARRRVEAVDPSSTAYVIATSGSTGRPKGVIVSHANLAASTFARAGTYADPPGRFLLTSSIGFDSSVVGLFWPLITGGSVVVASDADVRDVDRLADIAQRSQVTHLLMVPSLYRALLARRPDRLATLRTVIVAGEACPIDVADAHRTAFGHGTNGAGRSPATSLFNEYGPTEATVWASVHRLDTDRSTTVSIGRPIAGVTLRVADRDGRAVPTGVVAELLVSGPTVTDGYLGDEAATAARFVQVDDTRWYRTGDLARMVDRGGYRVVDFIGRVDDQLNVGGVRVEPGEIEAALVALPDVTDAVVVAATDGVRERLVALVVCSDSHPARDAASIRSDLGALLPASHVPARVVVHDALPRTSHGKLDRAAAALLVATDAPSSHPPSRSTLVDDIVAVWQRALGRTDVTASTDYFEAGGDSLAAVEIIAAIEDTVGRELHIATLLDGRTPEGMAQLVDPAHDTAGGSTEPSLRAEVGSSVDGVRLVTMQAGTDESPLVVLTPAWDDLFGYRPLVEALPDDVRVVAATVADTDPERIVTTIEALAAQFERALVDLAAPDLDRPVTLLGWSTAGVVAFDLAERLRGRGVDVRRVAMVDTYFPGVEQSLWSKRWEKYRSLLSPAAIAQEVSATIRRRSQSIARSLGTRLLRFSGVPVPEMPKRSSVGGVPLEALGYRPVPGATPVVMYAASATNPVRTHRGWVDVAEVEVVAVEGRHRGHRSIMAADRVTTIADDLGRRLAG